VSGREMRKSALRRYIVFWIKAIEFLDLNALRHSLNRAWVEGNTLLGGRQASQMPELRE